MSPRILFNVQLVLGYAAWLLCFSAYVMPRLRSMGSFGAQRAIATLHSFRFLGLIFIMPGLVGSLPAEFATFAAYGDLTTALLAMLALLTARMRPVFWFFVAAFNVVGIADLVVDYYHAVRLGLPAVAGQLGLGYAITMLYVPVLMITHAVALYWLLRPEPKAAAALVANAAAS